MKLLFCYVGHFSREINNNLINDGDSKLSINLLYCTVLKKELVLFYVITKTLIWAWKLRLKRLKCELI